LQLPAAGRSSEPVAAAGRRGEIVSAAGRPGAPKIEREGKRGWGLRWGEMEAGQVGRLSSGR